MFGLPQLPQWPAYTWTTLALLALMVLGALWACAKLALGSVAFTVRTTWHAFTLGLQAMLRRWAPALALHGTAHWASSHELDQADVWHDTQIPLATVGGKTVYAPAQGHIFVCAPPRSGKSWNVAMPVLRRWQGHAIVTDLRGELLTYSGDVRQSFSDVWCFDPSAEPDSPHHAQVNVMDLIRWGEGDAFADCHKMVRHLVDVQPGQPFDESAVEVLTGIALHTHQTGTCSLPHMRQWMTSTVPLRDKASELLASPDAFVAGVGRRLLDLSDRQRGSVWDRALQPLLLFADPRVAHWTSRSDVDLKALPTTGTPLSVFLCPTFSDIDRVRPLLRALIDGLITILGSVRTPPVHETLLLLDEAMNLGRLGGLEQGLSHLQGSGTKAMLIAQNVPQVELIYGQRSQLLAGMSTHVYFRPDDTVTAQHISETLGVTTVDIPAVSVSQQQSTSTAGGLWGRRVTVGETRTLSTTLQRRPLLTNDEVRRLPFSDALVVMAGLAPIYGQKLGIAGPTALQKVGRSIAAQPSRLALPLAACLALAALHPLWWHTALPTQQTAQASLFAPAEAPTTATPASTSTPATTEAPAVPAWQPPAFAGWRGEVILAASTGERWLIKASTPQMTGHTVATVSSHAACVYAMHKEFEPQIAGLEKVQQRRDSAPPMASWIGTAPDPNPAHKLSVERSLERLRWETYNATMDRRDVSEAWCEVEQKPAQAQKSITSDLSPKGFKPLGQK